jgi:signal transduction histidine kinase
MDALREKTASLTHDRAALASVAASVRRVAASCIPALFDAGPLITIVLGRDRRIVYANRQGLSLVGARSGAELQGLRFGEALGCIHATSAPDGCGSSPACCYCGASRQLKQALTILDAFATDGSGPLAPPREAKPAGEAEGDAGPAVFNPHGEGEECNIARAQDPADPAGFGESSLDLRVWSQAISLGGEGLVLLTALDISAEKRREVLERIFYHDIANTASGIRTILELLKFVDEEPQERFTALLMSAADQLVEEIESQRALKAAESRELAVKFEILDAKLALAEILALFAYKLEGKDISLKLAPGSARLVVESDATLLRRVLVNMIKNAIEAAVRGEVLLVGLASEKGGPGEPDWAVFWVKNSAVMPEVAQRRVFHRSFSTKGPGRGVGTYSMRLLAEGYLRGKVSFSSREGEGTIFELRIPQA